MKEYTIIDCLNNNNYNFNTDNHYQKVPKVNNGNKLNNKNYEQYGGKKIRPKSTSSIMTTEKYNDRNLYKQRTTTPMVKLPNAQTKIKKNNNLGNIADNNINSLSIIDNNIKKKY